MTDDEQVRDAEVRDDGPVQRYENARALTRLVNEAETGEDPKQVTRVYPPTIDAPEDRWVYMGACKYCGSEKPFKLYWRLKYTGPAGTAGLFNTQPLINAVWWPWAMCETCGHRSQGKFTHEHNDGEGEPDRDR